MRSNPSVYALNALYFALRRRGATVVIIAALVVGALVIGGADFSYTPETTHDSAPAPVSHNTTPAWNAFPPIAGATPTPRPTPSSGLDAQGYDADGVCQLEEGCD